MVPCPDGTVAAGGAGLSQRIVGYESMKAPARFSRRSLRFNSAFPCGLGPSGEGSPAARAAAPVRGDAGVEQFPPREVSGLAAIHDRRDDVGGEIVEPQRAHHHGLAAMQALGDLLECEAAVFID